VLAVRNEANRLPARIENLLAQQLTGAAMEVIVVCNNCTDETEQIAERISREDPRVHVLTSPAESGKAGAINAGVRHASGTLIVFADARQRFEENTVARLIHPFSDPHVGAVTGRLFISKAKDPAVEGFRQYWGIETALRRDESRTGSVIGATGAIYAIRRDLFVPLPPNLILDDVYLPMRIAMKEFRVVMAEGAIAIDVPAENKTLEYHRKQRTMVGNIQLIRVLPSLLMPRTNPLWFRFVSHKLLRIVSPFCFLGMLVLSAFLPGALYRGFFLAELSLYLLGFAGLMLSVSALAVPSAFLLIHKVIFSALLRSGQDAAAVWVQPAPR
jgi:cellulose synthase/poly-beta-1,6-N-acetylglucosamine synthase-like glycosyltransferase